MTGRDLYSHRFTAPSGMNLASERAMSAAARNSKSVTNGRKTISTEQF